MYGDALLALAVLQLRTSSKLKGALNMRKSYKQFEQCQRDFDAGKLRESPELARCLRFGVGLFYFALSIIPGNLVKVIELVGCVRPPPACLLPCAVCCTPC